jgi:hypothetical protein
MVVKTMVRYGFARSFLYNKLWFHKQFAKREGELAIVHGDSAGLKPQIFPLRQDRKTLLSVASIYA